MKFSSQYIMPSYQPQDVAAFLEEMETTEVLLDAILKSQNARVTVCTYMYPMSLVFVQLPNHST